MKAEPTINVLGSGGHAKVVIAALRAAGWRIAGIYDDNSARWQSELMGAPIVGPICDAASSETRQAIIAVGNCRARKLIAQQLDLDWISVVHPFSWVAPTATIGPGTVVCAGSVVQPDTIVGRHCILNTACSVDHDGCIEDWVHLCPGTRLAGNVTVRQGAMLGTGASVIPGRIIGAWATVGAGSTVIGDVEDGQTVVGSPAKVMRCQTHD